MRINLTQNEMMRYGWIRGRQTYRQNEQIDEPYKGSCSCSVATVRNGKVGEENALTPESRMDEGCGGCSKWGEPKLSMPRGDCL